MKSDTDHSASAFDVLIEIARTNPAIETFQFATLEFAPPLDMRAQLSIADETVITKALEYRSALHLPFWDGAMLAAAFSTEPPKGLFSAATYHQHLPNSLHTVSASDLSISRLSEMCDNATKHGQLLAITSLVTLNDASHKHLALLDFHTPFSNQATTIVKEVVRALGLSGKLLKSGKSYHFYGNSLISTESLVPFLAKALLFEPIIDRVWIAHQLMERRAALRISPRTEYGGVPTTVCSI